MLGNEITTLVDEYRDAGRYVVIFDSKDLSSGIYLIRLKGDEFIGTRKMTLLR